MSRGPFTADIPEGLIKPMTEAEQARAELRDHRRAELAQRRHDCGGYLANVGPARGWECDKCGHHQHRPPWHPLERCVLCTHHELRPSGLYYNSGRDVDRVLECVQCKAHQTAGRWPRALWERDGKGWTLIHECCPGTWEQPCAHCPPEHSADGWELYDPRKAGSY